MDKRLAIYQWAQLLVLSSVHFTVDMLGNMLPSILPEVRSDFAISLSLGAFVLAALTITANGIQLFTGRLRSRHTKPLFLHLGMALAVCLCLLPALPKSPLGISILIFLAVVCGGGIGIVHPEGLRGIHTLAQIPPAMSTAVFMTGGFVGFAAGGAISTALVSRFGLNGLYPLLLCPIFGILMVMLLRIRLAVESIPTDVPVPRLAKNSLDFRLVMIMAIPAAVSTTLIAMLLPTLLGEAGFALTFGGFSATMFGLGGALGSFVWAIVAHRKGELLCSALSFLLAGPFALAYLLLLSNSWAIWLVFAAGFCAFAGYILLITLARYAAGVGLGSRMGWIVGGTWLFASIVFMPIATLADRFGTARIMQYAPLGYLLSGIFGIYLLLRVHISPDQNQPGPLAQQD
ncbi:MAG: MFS transporter [Sedimentisphaerales bacterium]|nr:MFS transporter [Sedimentisphaerales bacterium]